MGTDAAGHGNVALLVGDASLQVSRKGTAAQTNAIEISGIMMSQTIFSSSSGSRSACLHYSR